MKQTEKNNLERIELIASGYEWICLKCQMLNKIYEIPKQDIIECPFCNTKFKIEDFFHAYG